MKLESPVKFFQRLYFSPQSPSNLAVCRILFFAAFFFYYLSWDPSVWTKVDRSFYMPHDLFSLIRYPLFPAAVIIALNVLWKISLLTSCLGYQTRISTALSFLLGLYLLGFPNDFGKIHHMDSLPVLVMGILAFSYCGDGLSLDAVRKKSGIKNFPERYQEGEYCWPLKLIQTLVCIVFFAAGISKLRHSGLEWIFSTNLQSKILGHYLDVLHRRSPPFHLGYRLAQSTLFCQMMAGAALFLEIAAPLVLIGPQIIRFLLAMGLFSMILGFWVIMGVDFPQYLICFLFWIPWEGLLKGSHESIRT